MSAIAERVRALLETHGVSYETLHHERDFSAQETAAHTHIPGREFAKAVVVHVAGEPALAVLPAHHVVDLERFSAALGGKPVELASEEEIPRLCPDCETGAVPPFGNVYGLPVYVSPELARNERITCVAGSHTDVIRLAYRDFERLVQPHVVDLSVVCHPEQHASGA